MSDVKVSHPGPLEIARQVRDFDWSGGNREAIQRAKDALMAGGSSASFFGLDIYGLTVTHRHLAGSGGNARDRRRRRRAIKVTTGPREDWR